MAVRFFPSKGSQSFTGRLSFAFAIPLPKSRIIRQNSRRAAFYSRSTRKGKKWIARCSLTWILKVTGLAHFETSISVPYFDKRSLRAMANEEHRKILKQGVEQWNKWRLEKIGRA